MDIQGERPEITAPMISQKAQAQRANLLTEKKLKEEYAKLPEEERGWSRFALSRERMIFDPEDNFANFNDRMKRLESELKSEKKRARKAILKKSLEAAKQLTDADKLALFRKYSNQIDIIDSVTAKEKKQQAWNLETKAEQFFFIEQLLAEVRTWETNQEFKLLGLGKVDDYLENPDFATSLMTRETPKEVSELAKVVCSQLQKNLHQKNIEDASAQIFAKQFLAFHALGNLAERATTDANTEQKLNLVLQNIREYKGSKFLSHEQNSIKEMLKSDAEHGKIGELGTDKPGQEQRTHEDVLLEEQQERLNLVNTDTLPEPLKTRVKLLQKSELPIPSDIQEKVV